MSRLIDADALIAYVKKRVRNEMIIAWLCRIIGEVPTIEAEPVRHGRWVCLEAEIGYFTCSECDHRILRAKCNYCPNCGAKMDKEDE